MLGSPVFVLAFLFLLVMISEWLCRTTFLRYLSSSLLVILLAAVAANLGWIPSASNASPIYDAIFSYVAPASIFFLLLGVSLKNLKQAGLPMLLMFSLGALGTVAGVVVALQLIDAEAVFGENYEAIGGMMTGTYIGGSVNFNAVALHYDVVREGATYTGVVVVDNIVTAIWMMMTLALPKLLQMRWSRRKTTVENHGGAISGHEDRETIDPLGLGLLLAMGLFAILISNQLADYLAGMGLELPSVLVLTTLALILAQLPIIQKLPGAKLLGMFSVYLFLAVVGAYCEITALADVGEKVGSIVLFTVAIVVVHGLVMYLVGALFKMDWFLIAVASQANIGGGSTALALAKSFDRQDLLLPGILAGSLGTGLGTYVGFLVAGVL